MVLKRAVENASGSGHENALKLASSHMMPSLKQNPRRSKDF
jgi:hypothetical protein